MLIASFAPNTRRIGNVRATAPAAAEVRMKRRREICFTSVPPVEGLWNCRFWIANCRFGIVRFPSPLSIVAMPARARLVSAQSAIRNSQSAIRGAKIPA